MQKIFVYEKVAMRNQSQCGVRGPAKKNIRRDVIQNRPGDISSKAGGVVRQRSKISYTKILTAVTRKEAMSPDCPDAMPQRPSDCRN